MAAIGALQQNIPLQAQGLRLPENPKSCFQRMKETALRIWNAIIHAIRSAGSQVSFLTFRALEWVNPNMALRAENLWVRLTNIWQGVQEMEAQKEMDDLRQRVLKTHDYEELALRNQQLVRERDQLFQAKLHAEQALQLRAQQEPHMQERAEALAGYRGVLLRKIEGLEAEKGRLIQERDEAKQNLAPVTLRNQELAHQLEELHKQVADLRVLQPTHQAMQAQLAAILRSVPAPHQLGRPVVLDQEIGALLPLLSAQLEDALDQLAAAKETLPQFSPALIAIQSIERILKALKTYHEETPKLLARHTRMADPARQLELLLLQQQPQVV